MPTYSYGLSRVTIENGLLSFSGVATEVSVDSSSNPTMLHGIPINDATAQWSVYPRDAIPGSADVRVRVTLQGTDPGIMGYILTPDDFNAEYKITVETADGSAFEMDGLKLVSISGRAPYETFTEVTVEFARVVISSGASQFALTVDPLNATIGTAVSINANGPSSINKIELYIDDTLTNTVTTNTMSYSWDTTGASAGDHSIVVKFYQGDTVMSTKTATVTLT